MLNFRGYKLLFLGKISQKILPPQGSKDLGKGLLEMACAPDGITEAWTLVTDPVSVDGSEIPWAVETTVFWLVGVQKPW